MKTKFTPGPWTLDSTLQYIRAPKEDEAFIGGGAICEVQSPLAWGGMDERVAQTRIANARLIAAAPDLYAVLSELEESCEYWSEYDVPLGMVDRIKSALKRAMGEE